MKRLLQTLIQTAAHPGRFFTPAPVAAAKKYIHLLGDFDHARIQVNGRNIDLARTEHVAATGRVCEHFKLRAGDVTYVLWNKPNQTQRAIQTGRRGHCAVDVGCGQALNLKRTHFEVRDVLNAAAAPHTALGAALQEKSDSLRARLAQLRAARPERAVFF